MIKAGMSFYVHLRYSWPLTILVTALALLLVAGCAGLQIKTKQEITPQAKVLIDRLAQQNEHILQLKGLGSYRLVNADGPMSGRIGWACRRPDRFRTDILDLGGRPAATIASDGQWLYVRFKGERKIYKRSKASAVLKKTIGSPVSIKEITAFLSGRVPLFDYQIAQVRAAGDDQGPVLSLKRKPNQLSEEVFFNADASAPRRVVFYTKSGKVAYQVDLVFSKEQGEFAFFQNLSFSTKSGNRFNLRVDKLWLGTDLPNSLFDLNDS